MMFKGKPATRRRLVGGSVVAAGVLVVSSAAFACTVFYGVTTVSTAGGTSVSVGDTSAGHSFCSLTGGAKASSGEAITVTVSAASTCLSASGLNKLRSSNYWVNGLDTGQPRQGPYHVRFLNGAVFNRSPRPGGAYTFPDATNCVDVSNALSGAVTLLGLFQVDDTGYGTWSGTLPSGLTNNGPSDSSALCPISEYPTWFPTPQVQESTNLVEKTVYGRGWATLATMAPIVIM